MRISSFAFAVPVMTAFFAAAQAGHLVQVKNFAGSTIGEKVAAAEESCKAESACILVLDPSLATTPAGTVPPLCPGCSIQDSRDGGQPLTSQAIPGLQTFAALPATGQKDEITNRFKNFIHSTSAPGQSRARGVLWIGPQEPANALDSSSNPVPLSSEFNSSQRIFDLRGTNCMDPYGRFTVRDNSFCFEGTETEQDITDVKKLSRANAEGIWKNMVHIGFNSLQGGTYSFSGPGSGTKSNRHALAINGEYHTTAQNGLIVGLMSCLTGGECMGFNVNQTYPGGYIGPGEEAMQGVRIQQQQTYGLPDGAGGYWSAANAQVNAASGAVSFTPGSNAWTLAEARAIRDLDTAYSAGSYSNVTCAGPAPVTCTVAGDGTNWTRIHGFVGTHTRFVGVHGPISSTNLVFCAAPGAQGGFDACVPVTAGIDDTHLTLNLLAVGTQGNTPWPWAKSGQYAIYSAAWPTQVDPATNTFTASDLSGIGNGHRLDQVVAYNGDAFAIEVFQSRHIGRVYGGGINILDWGEADSPAYGCAFCASGHYNTVFSVGESNFASGVPAVILGMHTPGTVGTIVDSAGGDGFQNAWRYLDSNRTLQTAIGYTRDAASPVAGLAFFAKKAYITTAGTGEFQHVGNSNRGADFSGSIAISSSAQGTYTFSVPYSDAPRCVASPTSNPGTNAWWVTATPRAVTIHLSAAGSIEFNYICTGT